MYLFTGFPWALIGYSQVPFPAVAQAASIVGVLGVSALVVLVNGTVACAVVAGPRAARTPLVVTAALVAGAVAFGVWRLQDGALLRAGSPLRVAALQGNVRQDEKWRPSRSDAILETYLEQTRQAVAAGAGLVVWPESATPFALDGDRRGELVRAVARETRAHLLVGTTEGGTGRRHAVLQRGLPDRAREGLDVRRVPQAAPGAVRRVRAVAAGAVLRLAAGGDGGRFLRRHGASASPGRRQSGRDRHLLRDHLSRSGTGAGAPWQRAAGDRHETMPGTGCRRRRISTFSRRRCGPSSRAAFSSARPTPASAA